MPSHFDGHQHVHIIPEICEIIANVMTNQFGIYQTRVPIENLEINNKSQEKIEFFQEVIEQSKISKLIFQQYKIQSTDIFLGINHMGQNLQIDSLFQKINEIFSQNDSLSIEMMVHPGYKSYFGDDFNQSEERQHEFYLLSSDQFASQIKKQNINLTSYSELKRKYSPKWKIVLLSLTNRNNGNYITSLRLKGLIEQQGYEVFIYPNLDFNKENQELLQTYTKNFIKFCLNNEINLIMGLNAFRSGKVIQQAKLNDFFQIPYIVILAGTDTNQYLLQKEHQQNIIEICQKSDYLLSLSKNGLDQIMKCTNYNQFNTKVIYQSASLKVNENFSFRKKFNLNEKVKIVILPAGIRRVKDINFVLESMFKMLNNQYLNHYFFILGSILDQNYFEEITNNIEIFSKEYPLAQDRIKLLPGLSHQDYLQFLKNDVNLLLNTSINEGLCGSIVEAFFMKTPVLVRSNCSNVEITDNGKYGFLFETTEQFREIYSKIFNNNELMQNVESAYEFAQNNLTLEIEKESYAQVIKQLIEKRYKEVFFVKDRKLKLLQNNVVHQIQKENLQLFDQIKLDLTNIDLIQNLNLLDIGCGQGIFGIYLIKQLINNGIKAKSIIFSDYQKESVDLSYLNINLNLNLFQNHIKKFKFIQSDMLQNIEEKFDIIVANFPQTPFPECFKIDRCGFNDGCKFNKEFISQLDQVLEKKGQAFMLLTSLSNPRLISQLIKKHELIKIDICSNQRNIQKQDLQALQDGLYDYLLINKQLQQSEFEDFENHIQINAKLVRLQNIL